jgi:hypothetical protein
MEKVSKFILTKHDVMIHQIVSNIAGRDLLLSL